MKKSPEEKKYIKVGKKDRLEIRIHPVLRKALLDYCGKHLESTTEATTRAIKAYIGFEKR